VSTLERDSATLFGHGLHAEQLTNAAVYGLFGLYLLLVVIGFVTDAVLAWHLAAATVPFGAILGWRRATEAARTPAQFWLGATASLGLALAVIGIVYRSASPGLEFGFGLGRSLSVVVVLLVFLAYLLVVTDVRRCDLLEWVALGCFAALAGIYLAHSVAFDPGSSQSRWPVWATVVLGSALFVFPRLVPGRVFLWLVARLAAIVVALGLATYAVGEYTIWLFTVDQYPPSSPWLPGLDPEVSTLQSLFPNPNSLGLLAFAGVVAAVVNCHRSLLAGRPLGAGVASLLAVVCGAGVVLSNARAAILASAIAIGIYAIYVVAGRATLPVTAVSGLAVGLAVIAVIYVGAFGVTGSARTGLWNASVAAIADGPLLFGHGNGPATTVMETYHPDGRAALPHNAYLEVAIQSGLIGLLAYLGLTVGTVVARAVDYRTVDAAMLALATGWLVHQGLESYTLFRWSLSSVLAALAIGYLLTRE
jgi:hypothetical protein